MSYNPYDAPRADVLAPVLNDVSVEQTASGQKLVIYAILTYFAAAAIKANLGAIGWLIALCALAMGLVGVFRLSAGMGYSMATKVILTVLMFVPLVSLIVLLVLNAKGTNKLRAAGYRVGLLGASR
ncbi:hypothetical protein [Dyella tabacisoli]|uniref:Uncharacterized protein n=1 Tax=Dyella tabacisoli TaxID=2282381 RepID=A0A369UPR9_9GAMM|nr:hypothetical protein [Dyella tabacisoli]RDD82744.1 hypothetical protein DVJ77_04280 [Dyella tabacisoli]